MTRSLGWPGWRGKGTYRPGGHLWVLDFGWGRVRCTYLRERPRKPHLPKREVYPFPGFLLRPPRHVPVPEDCRALSAAAVHTGSRRRTTSAPGARRSPAQCCPQPFSGRIRTGLGLLCLERALGGRESRSAGGGETPPFWDYPRSTSPSAQGTLEGVSGTGVESSGSDEGC